MIKWTEREVRSCFLGEDVKMSDLKEFINLYKERPVLLVITFTAMVIGAGLGAAAFYNGWLG